MLLKIKPSLFLIAFILIAGCQEEVVPPIIEADFEVATDSPIIFQHVEFDNLPDGAMNYHWDFGNGITSDEKYPELVYFEEPKIYQVSLTTTSLGGVKRTITKDIQIGAYFIKNLKILPEEGLKAVVTDISKIRLVILQKNGSENVPVFEAMAFESAESLDAPVTVPINSVGFGQIYTWAGYPIIRLIDDQSGEILVDTEYAGGSLQFSQERNSGISVIQSNIYNPSGFELEFFFGYSSEQ